LAGRNPFPTVPDPAEEPEPPFEPDKPKTEPGSGEDFRDVRDAYPTGEAGVSFKLGTGFEAPMIHFKAHSLEGLADIVGYERNGQSGSTLLIGLGEYAAYTSKFLTGTYTTVTGRKLGATGGSGGSPGSGGGGGRPGRPAEAVQAPAWMGSPPDCAHGARKYVTKTKANGDRWHAWGCSGPQGDNCEPGLIFENAPKG
jgi:hypothetical protein